MLDNDKQDNLTVLQECLSDRLIEKLTLAPPKTRGTRSKKRSRRAPTGDNPISASIHAGEATDTDIGGLADFIEVWRLSCQIMIMVSTSLSW